MRRWAGAGAAWLLALGTVLLAWLCCACLGALGPASVGATRTLLVCEHHRVALMALTSPYSPAQELEEARKEAAALVELLELRQGSLAATLAGGFPELRDTGGCHVDL